MGLFRSLWGNVPPTIPFEPPSGDPSELLLGRYRVIQTCGQGGFGCVRVCWDPRLMRRVAIKSIPLQAQTPGRRVASPAEKANHDALLRASLAETRTVSMLSHPNIVSMIDFESDDENAYIIMEYVEGASLADLLDATDDHLLTSDEAAAVCEAVCDALQFAHENGVLHLDIKPANILIEMSGRVKLVDFGMATLSSATGYTGARGGTIGYMPPEQLQGQQVDVRTDVFALAAVLYESLTGVRLYAAGSIQESLGLVCSGAPDPIALNETITVRAADSLMAALHPDPEERPQSIEELASRIMPGLGRPKAGRRSLAALVADVLDDSVADPADEQAERADPYDPELFEKGPLTLAAPRLAGWLARALGAAGSGALAYAAAAASLAGPTAGGPAILACCVALLTLAAPQLGAAIALAGGVAAALVHQAWLAGGLLAATGIAWWVLVCREKPLESTPTLAACLGFSPLAAVPALLCGYLLPAWQAALSALAGAAAHIACTQLAGGATPEAATWLGCLGWVGAAAVMGALAHGRSKGPCYLGCLLAGLVLAGFALLGARVENGGSWTSLSPDVLVYVAGSTILLLIVVFLLGAPRSLDLRAGGRR